MSLAADQIPPPIAAGELLDGVDESASLAMCELASLICATPLAGVNLRGADGRWWGAWHGAPAPSVPPERTPCAEVLRTGEPLVLGDLHEHARVGGDVWELGGLRAYLGVPIRSRDGHALGTMCVLDTVPREFTATQLRGIATLANQLASGLELLSRTREAVSQRFLADAELAESQQRFHALVESSPLAIFALDAQRKPIFVSDGCAHLFGTASNRYDESGWIPALHEDDRERALAEWEHAFRSQVSLDVQYRIYDAAGCVQELVVRAAAMHTSAGEFSGWVGTITDVTEQVRANRDLVRSRQESEQARVDLEARNHELQAVGRAKDVVLAAVSHEFRTPLTSIKTFLQMLAAEDGLSGSQHQSVAVIARNVDRLDRLVTDLLSIKESPGEIDVSTEEVDLQALAEEAVEAAILRAQDMGVDLIAERGPPVPAVADRRRMAQVLDALLDNALKFTPAGGRIVVRARTAKQRGKVEVSDSGVGIALDEQERIFDRFYQGAAGRGSGRGSGLGLAIVSRLLEAQQASIGVRSRPGCGTTMVISLPSTPAA